MIVIDRQIDFGRREGLDSTLHVVHDARGELSALIAVKANLDRGPGMLELAPQRDQPMAIARLGLLRLQGLEQDNVPVEQAGHATHETIGEP
jgi:hypothetical protein